MNKRGIISFIFVFLATLISFYFMIFTSMIFSNESIWTLLLISIIPITIFMYQELKYIKKPKIKFIYDILLLLLTIASIGIIIYIAYTIISCAFSENCSYELFTIYTILYIPTIVAIFLLSIPNIFRKTNKLNDYLTIIASIIIVLIHLRYYIDPNLLNNIYPNMSGNDIFVTQDYIYFIILVVTVILHKFINRVS